MHRLLLLTGLAVAEAATLLSGAAATTTVAARTPAPAHVIAPVSVPPAITTIQPVLPAARPVTAPPRHQASSRPVHRRSPAVRRTAVRHVIHRTASPAVLMRQAIARIPGYSPGVTRWVMTSAYGHWGTAVLGGDTVYVSPTVPPNRMYDVVAHEWSHMLSVRDYDMDVNAALDALNRTFGGSGIDGAERAADCMAKQLGARWTHYTSCTRASWQAAARKLLAHQRL